MPLRLPSSLQKYFWGDDLAELNWQDHQKYIVQTILEKGDRQAAAWLLSQFEKKELVKQLSSIKLSKKSANFWQVYLS